MSRAPFQQKIDDAVAAIAAARQALADGATADLAGLDRMVAEACAAARVLPAQGRAAAADALGVLVGTLTELAADLTRRNGGGAA